MEEEIQIVYRAINHPTGFDIDFADILIIRRYEHPVWAIEWEGYNSSGTFVQVKEFTDPLEAASFFLSKKT